MEEDVAESDTWVFVAVGLVALIALSVYLYFFGLWKVSGDPQHWGQFGDYVGGLMNPVVALAALFMLFQSVRLQRYELKRTRSVLKAQADSARDSAKLAALTTMLESRLAEIQLHREHVHFLVNQLAKQDDVVRAIESRYMSPNMVTVDADYVYAIHDIEGQKMTREEALRTISMVNQSVTSHMLTRLSIERQVNELLEAMSKKEGE